ncbi:MAG: hypothetical protein FVQ83_07220 [Chloroflexi bacterium]|nr:hypothetical protein [Chloroflexota bacterium]
MANEDNLHEISIAINQLAKLQAYSIVQSDEWIAKKNVEKILFLNSLGFRPKDISEIIQTTIGTVKKEISTHKNK